MLASFEVLCRDLRDAATALNWFDSCTTGWIQFTKASSSDTDESNAKTGQTEANG